MERDFFMKKILIISYNFAPRNVVGAIRPTKLAKALKEAGHHVDVVTVRPFGETDHFFDDVLEKLDSITYVGETLVQEKAVTSSSKVTDSGGYKKMTLKLKLKREARELIIIKKSKKFAKSFKKELLANLEKYRSYDAVITSYGPLACHYCGLLMKKYCPDVKWMADFRDPMVVNHTSFLTKGYRGRLQNKICKRADSLVAVSNGYYNRIFGEKYKHKASVIYNGFDRNDLDLSAIEPDGLFSFTYVGALYEGKRDPAPLFEVLKELCDEGKIDRNDIHIKYAGTHYLIIKQAKRYGFEDRVTDYGMLPRKQCLELQAQSRHLLLLTWNEKGENGVFPGKFLEYIMMGKPIISIVTGEEPDSEVSVVMKRANLGLTYEEATKERDRAALKEYVYKDYLTFKAGKLPELDVNKKEIDRFDFANAAKQIEELI